MGQVDQNGRRVYKAVRKEPDGTWSANVWWGGGGKFVTNVTRFYGYRTRQEAKDSDISEAPPRREQ